MKKRVLTACLALLSCVILASCGSIKSDSEFDDKSISLSMNRSKIITNSAWLENGTLTTYTPKDSIINYFSFDSFIKYLGDNFDDNYSVETKDGIVTVNYEEDVVFSANAMENTIRTNTQELYFNKADFGSLEEGYEYSCEVLDNGNDRIIDLDDYEMDIICINNEVLLPGTVIMFYLVNGMNHVSYYNGKNYCILDGPISTEEHINMALDGAKIRYVFNNKLHKYHYNFTRMLMNEFYGLSDYYSYDEKLVEKYKDDFLSSDTYTRIGADINFLADINEGHTAILGYPLAYFYGYNNINEKDNEFYNNYYDLSHTLEKNRGKNFKEYVEIDDTAFVTLDTFYIDQSQSDDYEENTHVILKNALENASKNSNIKNFVVNLAGNGGGYIMEEFKTLGLLFNDDIAIYTENPKTHYKEKNIYKIDADGDNDYTDADSYEGMFNFYVLTSPLTFSAGNSFALYCKANGIKTIGQKSGGGACYVSHIALPDGTTIMFSSNTKSYQIDLNGNTVEMEAGATPDIEITDFNKIENFQYIYNLIH